MKPRLSHGIAFLMTLVSLVSCDRQVVETDLKYFDVNGFTEELVSELKRVNCRVNKDFTINQNTQQEDTVVQADSTYWDREFKVFREHDINKPVLRDAYEIKRGTTDGGQHFEEYVLAEKDEQGVIYMKIIFDDQERVQFWESVYHEQNLLYANRRLISMELDHQNPTRHVHSYQVEGFHKLMFKDSVTYRIKASLECP